MPGTGMIDAFERSQNPSNNSSSNTSTSSNNGQEPTAIERVGEAIAKTVTFVPAVAIAIAGDGDKAERFWETSGEVGKKVAKTAEDVAKSPAGKATLGTLAALGGASATVKLANDLKNDVKKN